MSLLTLGAAGALAMATTVPCVGRYVTPAPVGAFGATAIDIGAGQVALEPACPSVPARLRRRGRHWRVAAAWPRCGAYRAVRLRALLDRDCTLLSGRVRARGVPATRLSAPASVCGDGIVDPGRGEGCDDGNALGGDSCTAICGPCDPEHDVPNSTWQGLQINILMRYGCPNCHAPGAINALDLRPEVAYAHIVGVPAASVDGFLLVAPGDETRSLLLLKLAKGRDVVRYEQVPGSGMPPGASLDDEEFDALARWIGAGAPPTGVVPGTEAILTPCRPRAAR